MRKSFRDFRGLIIIKLLISAIYFEDELNPLKYFIFRGGTSQFLTAYWAR
jgi:hypothetical protein